MSGELPAEVQAIVDAALAWADSYMRDEQNGSGDPESIAIRWGLSRAARAYREATAPPEPFEVYASYYEGEELPLITHGTTRAASRVWRCKVTPIERVR